MVSQAVLKYLGLINNRHIMGAISLWFLCTSIPVTYAQELVREPDNKPAVSTSQYLAAVEEIESETGPYSLTLTEPLWGLGQALQEQGDFVGAARIFKRAAHLTRINEGLYSSRQIPLLEAFVAANKAAGRWQDVNGGYGHLYWLYQRAFAQGGSVAYFEGLKKIRDWHLASAGFDEVAKRQLHLERVNQVDQLILMAAERQYDKMDLKVAPALYDLALSYYYLALSKARELDSRYSINNPSRLQRLSRSSSVGLNDIDRSDFSEVHRYLRNGREALERIQSIYAKASSVSHQAQSMALIYMADWELLSEGVKTITRAQYFNNSSLSRSGAHVPVAKSVATYRLVHERLQQQGVEPLLLERFFARAVALPVPVFTVDFDEALAMTDPPPGGRPFDKSQAKAEMDGSVPNRADETVNAKTKFQLNSNAFVSWSSLLKGVSYPGKPLLSSRPDRLVEAIVSTSINSRGRAEGVRIVERKPANIGVSRVRNEIRTIQFRPPLSRAKAIAEPVILHYQYVRN